MFFLRGGILPKRVATKTVRLALVMIMPEVFQLRLSEGPRAGLRVVMINTARSACRNALPTQVFPIRFGFGFVIL